MLSARIDFDGTHVLDLYAGSGALGVEAASRGAATVAFVESDRRAADVIAANVAQLGVDGATVHRTTVAAALTNTTARPVDLVFADPPYAVTSDEVAGVLAALSTGGWAVEGTVAVVERPAAAATLDWPPGWEAWPQRRYGDTRLEFGEYGSLS